MADKSTYVLEGGPDSSTTALQFDTYSRAPTRERCGDLNASVVSGTRSGLVASVARPDYQALLQSFPTVLNASKVLPQVKHDVEHIITTHGRPVAGRYRWLDPRRLEAARREFLDLEKQGIVRRCSSSCHS